MLYVVGDSNSVYTSSYLIGEFNVSLCKVGWTTEDVLRAILRKKDLSDASAFFVFVGMNDRLTGEGIASNVLQIVSALRARRSSTEVRVVLAPPFCVDVATPPTLCADRRDAARRIAREMGAGGMGCILVTPHVTKDMYAKKSVQVLKARSSSVDPLHLSATAYMSIANAVNEYTVAHATRSKRSSKPPKLYEGGPAPSPRVAWAMARARG